ncbi:MAG: hypothetical protein MK111_12185 [Crocosphaera sp.]|uniref:hypothetical protein n=1 Tax=Crocosphaera sp. TaxID=2729996 RepID=UPI00258D2D99|nr:hypothetical protein [Crocosphaera sp.]MCH2245386.1 hypothetical protein [Crocosphaera sp.]
MSLLTKKLSNKKEPVSKSLDKKVRLYELCDQDLKSASPNSLWQGFDDLGYD